MQFRNYKYISLYNSLYKTDTETLFLDSVENGVLGTELVWWILETKE